MKRLSLFIFLFLKLSLCQALPAHSSLTFYRLGIHDGLSNNQVNSVFKDSKGYIWLGTQSGLDRFDGFRFSNFFSKTGDKSALLNDVVNDIQEDIETNLWLKTSAGYCRFNRDKGDFDTQLSSWMRARGMKGVPYFVKIDRQKNMWLAVRKQGIYYYDVRKGTAFLFSQQGKGRNVIRETVVTDVAEDNGCAVLVFDNGTLVKADGRKHRVCWVNKDLKKKNKSKFLDYSIFIDNARNLWLTYAGKTTVWSAAEHHWYDSVDAFLTSQGYQLRVKNIIVKCLKNDKYGRLWLATDHDGLLNLDPTDHHLTVYQYDSNQPESLPDNTIMSICFDNLGGLWLGSYKNGAAYCSPNNSRFRLIALGDICSVVEDQRGNLWCGTNDKGIIVYNPATGITHSFRSNQTGLGSDVVVSSTIGKDGSLWFGAFNGGLTCYKGGQFKAYRASERKEGLANDNVWALKTEENGNIVIATLGGGLQLLNPQTGHFTTYNIHNSQILSDFISSLSFDLTGNIIMGHAQEYSLLDVRTHKVKKFVRPHSGKLLSVSSVNQVFVDSRGLVWNAGSSGLSVYNPQTDSIVNVPLFGDRKAGAAYAVIEDLSHAMWVTTDQGVSHLTVRKDDGRWNFFITDYSDVDGLQRRQFNCRAILLCRNGAIVVGGQDGINILTPQSDLKLVLSSKALFSGLLVFNQPVRVGDDYNGHVILKEELHDGGELRLNHDENAFTIQLSSNIVSIPNRSRFLYRLKGFDDKWLQTADGQPAVTFTNLSSGSYTLEVKVVNADGTQSREVSRLKIYVRPPFYLSAWAMICYVVLLVVLFYYVNRALIKRSNDKLRLAQVTREAEQARHLDKMKLDFFANISHELRTPLSLILSPLSVLISQEKDETKRTKLQLISRNATRLLGLVNQLLDFRKIDEDCQQMKLVTGDVVAFIHEICNTFQQLMGPRISLTFYASTNSLMMSFDDDKLRKIMDNLLSNAYKFTPNGGRIDVSLRVVSQHENGQDGEKQLEIKVSDTGSGIDDEAKKHVFERFYQAPHTDEIAASGSGIGLSLVKKFVEMHGGTISVSDNPGGGTVFICLIPICNHVEVPLLKHCSDTMQQVERQAASSVVDMQPAAEDAPVSASCKAENGQKYELLIVDDSEDFLEFMAEVLSHKFHVRVAHDGKEALMRVEEHRPDVILSDVMMPEMDGNALCRALKENRNTCDIPFIMLTARVAEAHRMESLELGADDYITKPFSMDLLDLRISNLIKWHHGPKNNLIEPKIKQVEITSMDEEMVRNATTYVEDNLDNTDISVETLSASLGMSRVQLYKRLLSVTGLTPSEFIRNIRLRHAEVLLRQSQRSVSEIAYQVGFNNPRYFSRYFADMYGVTPSQYKQRYGK